MTTLDELVAMAAADNDVVADQILSRIRAVPVATARHQVCWVLRQSGWSYPAIGKAVGRDHTTVMHSVGQARIRRWMVGVRVLPPTARVFRDGCAVVRCGRPHRAHGLCEAHLARQRRYGDPVAEVPIGATGGQVAEAVMRREPAGGVCEGCGGVPMPGALRCLDCFHGWLADTRGPMWGTSSGNAQGRGHEAVRQVRTFPSAGRRAAA